MASAETEGDRPGGPQSPPGPHPNSPKPRALQAVSGPQKFAASARIRAQDLLSGPFREALAEHMAELAAAEHVRAA